jgi:hypothetical protein
VRGVELSPARRTIGQGKRATLALKLSKKAQAAAARALGRLRRVQAKVTVTIRDAAGNASLLGRTIRLRR